MQPPRLQHRMLLLLANVFTRQPPRLQHRLQQRLQRRLQRQLQRQRQRLLQDALPLQLARLRRGASDPSNQFASIAAGATKTCTASETSTTLHKMCAATSTWKCPAYNNNADTYPFLYAGSASHMVGCSVCGMTVTE